MPADFVIVENDTAPVLNDTLTLENGNPAPLEGATVQLVLRTPTAPEPLTLAGTLTFTPETAEVAYRFAAPDTHGRAGMYLGSWDVTYADGTQQTFPTVGYLWVEIQASLATAGGGAIVGLPEVLDYLNIPSDDRVHDTKLMGYIAAVGALIEAETGPMVVRVYDEWFNGGHATIALPNRPSTGFGTTPILRLLSASEYRGPIEFDLAIIQTPAEGQIYSVMLDPELGTVTRRTAGGGVMPFPYDPQHGDQQVHLKYQAGQEQIPENVKLAAKETIRQAYDTTQAVGRGRRTVADEQETTMALAQAFSAHGSRLLTPNRRYPSIA